jgi:hypothetical protein
MDLFCERERCSALIPIKMQPEPAHFFAKVQKKGERFLQEHPGAKGKQLQPYWRTIIPGLHRAYSGICAYTCHWIAPDTGSATVDHFKPKENYPEHAYRWDNYRLVCGTMNGRKGKYEDVLDPFTLPEGWFQLLFPSLLAIPNKNLQNDQKKCVESTIKRLKLNDDTCISGRQGWLVPYLQGEYPISHLEKRAPFLAYELKRQSLQDIELPIWAAFKK